MPAGEGLEGGLELSFGVGRGLHRGRASGCGGGLELLNRGLFCGWRSGEQCVPFFVVGDQVGGV